MAVMAKQDYIPNREDELLAWYANIAAKLLVPGRVEAVAGVNLPMLLRALTYRDRSLQVIVTKAVSGGCDGVVRVPPALTAVHNAATGT